MTFEEAYSHENKAVDNPTGDIETTDNENEKRSRAIRKAKLPFDPSTSPNYKKKSAPKRSRIIRCSDTEDDEPPRPPTPPTILSTTSKKGKSLSSSKDSGHIPVQISSVNLSARSSREVESTRTPSPLTFSYGTGNKGKSIASTSKRAGIVTRSLYMYISEIKGE